MTTKIEVEYLDHMGNDLSVVNAARVSFDKTSDWVQRPYTYIDDKLVLLDEELEFEMEPFENCALAYDDLGRELSDRMLSKKDEKLIGYLARHNHKSPFNHAFAKFRVKAPIFVARQLVKHEYMPWNEVSRRYVDSAPTHFRLISWRYASDDVKQGSGEIIDNPLLLNELWNDYNKQCDEAERLYNKWIYYGVCAEQVRAFLLQSVMTEWVWSGSLFAIAKMCNLRLDSHTQKETQEVARAISDKMGELFPVSWKALIQNH